MGYSFPPYNERQSLYCEHKWAGVKYTHGCRTGLKIRKDTIKCLKCGMTLGTYRTPDEFLSMVDQAKETYKPLKPCHHKFVYKMHINEHNDALYDIECLYCGICVKKGLHILPHEVVDLCNEFNRQMNKKYTKEKNAK